LMGDFPKVYSGGGVLRRLIHEGDLQIAPTAGTKTADFQ